MDGEQRREALLQMLGDAREPLSGSALARRLGVSRQVIVQDIALLRATNRDILSTARGYLLYNPAGARCNRCFMVSHSTQQIADELNTIVDLGGKVLDVIITHPIYGTITVNLIISSRRDVQDFVRKIATSITIRWRRKARRSWIPLKKPLPKKNTCFRHPDVLFYTSR